MRSKACLPLPLVKPDVRISRIRLSCKYSSYAKQTWFLEILISAHLFGTVIFTLTTTVQMAMHPISDIVVQGSKPFRGVAVIEIAAPAFQLGVKILHNGGRGLEASIRASLFTDCLAGFEHGLLRWEYIQIAIHASVEVAVVPECEPQEVQTLTLFEFHDGCLVPVYA